MPIRLACAAAITRATKRPHIERELPGHVMLYLKLWSSLMFVLAVPGFIFARMLIIGRSENSAPAAFIAISLACTCLIMTYATLFGFSAYAFFLCVVTAAVMVTLYDIARPRASAADLYSLRALAAGLIAGALLVGCFWFFWRITPAVFPGSDTIATWNKWAKIWASGQFPVQAYGYPQLVPALWGSIYIWLGDSIQYGPTYLFILLLVVPPVAATMWSGEHNPILACWMVGVYGAFVVHFRGWLGSTVVASFPDWLVVAFIVSALVIAAPRLFDASSRQSDDSFALIIAQVYLCAAASIKPLAGLLAVALLLSSALLRLKSARSDLKRSIIVQVLVVALAVATFLTYYVQVVNAVVLPAPKSAGFVSQIVYGAGFVGKAVFPIFLVLSLWGLAATASSRHLWPFSLACVVGFAIWARTASYDLRNVLPFLIASILFGVCGVAKAIQDHRLSSRIAGRILVPAERRITIPTYVTLLAFGMIVAVATLPLMKSDDEIRNAFLKGNRAIGLGSKINAMAIAAAKKGCWIGTNVADLHNLDELAELPNKQWFSQLEVNDVKLRDGLESNCWMLVILTPSLFESTRKILATYEEKALLRHHSKGDWEIYASSNLSFPEQPF
jgi:hypothetical protein